MLINIKNSSEEIADLAKLPIPVIDFIIESVVNKIVERVANGEKINVSGLGQFKKIIRKGRMCRNPRTGEPMRWEDIEVVKFRPASRFTKTIRNAK